MSCRQLRNARQMIQEKYLGGAWILVSGLLATNPNYSEARIMHEEIQTLRATGIPDDPPSLSEAEAALLYP